MKQLYDFIDESVNRSGTGSSSNDNPEECYFNTTKSSIFSRSLDDYYNITEESYDNFTLAFYVFRMKF